MNFGEKLTTAWKQACFYLRLAPHARNFLPSGQGSASTLMELRARENADHTALLFKDRSYTWKQANAETDRWANFFEGRGIGPGDSVALLMDNRPEYIFAMLGLVRLHAVAALINTNISGKGLTHAIQISKACACIVGSEHASKLDEIRETLENVPTEMIFEQAEDTPTDLFSGLDALLAECSTTRPEATLPKGDAPMCYIYTSGTTGLPKAAIIKNSRWYAAATLFGRGLLEVAPGDINYVPLPLYHSTGMFAGLGSSLVTGATLALRTKFSASNFWSDVRKYNATAFVYIGELLRYLLNQPATAEDRNHRVRVITGNGLRPDIWTTFAERFQIHEIREFYGATEGNAPTVNLENRPGMVGRLGPGQSILRCDLATGEVLRNADGFCEKVNPGETGLLVAEISTTAPFDGYADKEATAKKILHDILATGDSFFNSGDLITLHENWWISFADRVGDTFRWKGENVSTNEVAEVLNDAPGVLESNVYGVVIPGTDGRAGMASLNCREDFSLETFAQFVTEKLPGYQRPYFLRLQEDMRITGTFKHQKVDYRKEGFDPTLVSDPLFFLDGETYHPVDQEVFTSLQDGSRKLR